MVGIDMGIAPSDAKQMGWEQPWTMGLHSVRHNDLDESGRLHSTMGL